jgi:hypothetical protein
VLVVPSTRAAAERLREAEHERRAFLRTDGAY